MISFPTNPRTQAPPRPADQPRPKKRLGAAARSLLAKFLGGMLFAIPLLVVIVVLRQVIGLLAKLLAPAAKLLPERTIGGVLVVDILAIALIVALCFALGIFVGTKWGRWISARLERTVLRKVPGYSLLKSATHSAAGMEQSHDVRAALARIEDAWVPAFVIEQHMASGLFTVFVPGAPAPTSGSIYFLSQDRVKVLNLPVSKVVSCIMKLGVDSGELLDAAMREDERAFSHDPVAARIAEDPSHAKGAV